MESSETTLGPDKRRYRTSALCPIPLSGNPTNRELTQLSELRFDVSMLKRLWRKIAERHRRNIAELDQIEIELAKEEAHLPLLPSFPQKPYKASTIVLFTVFGVFVAFAALVCLKELAISIFR
jgi:hypothetical protein